MHFLFLFHIFLHRTNAILFRYSTTPTTCPVLFRYLHTHPANNAIISNRLTRRFPSESFVNSCGNKNACNRRKGENEVYFYYFKRLLLFTKYFRYSYHRTFQKKSASFLFNRSRCVTKYRCNCVSFFYF